MGDIMKTSPLSICDWDESLDRMTLSTPETVPGSEQRYHYLSFGWLCGGIIEVSFQHPSLNTKRRVIFKNNSHRV